jgi:hypothetical protein
MLFLNCVRCGRVHTTANQTLCPKCYKTDEERFSKVRDFVKDNQYCTILEAAAATKVSAKTILRYVREGRIEATEGMFSAGEITCNRCDMAIMSGLFCRECAQALAQELQDAFNSKPKPMMRMHTTKAKGNSKGE